MRFFLAVLVVSTLLGGGYYLRAHPEAAPLALGQLRELPQQLRGLAEKAKQRVLPSAPLEPAVTPHQPQTTTQPDRPTQPKGSAPPTPASSLSTQPIVKRNQMTLYLTNGGVVTGELVRQTQQGVTLRWDYGDVTFARQEIKRMVEGRKIEGEDDIVLPPSIKTAQWPYTHEAVFRLMNGAVVDAELAAIDAENLHLAQTVKGGGTIELTIPRTQLDQVMFRPIANERSQEIHAWLSEIFPKMGWYEEGMFTIVTDSLPTAVKEYRRTVRELSTDFYLTFWPLLKDRHPTVQQFIVIFDSWPTFIEYAAIDGLPGWAVLGYFDPDKEVLYLYNTLGEWFSELLYEVYLGQFREARDRVMKTSGIQGSRYEIFIEGQISEFLQKLESAHARLRQFYDEITIGTLRHELTHALLHNWKAQTIHLSKMVQLNQEEAKDKRRLLESDDVAAKRKILDELMNRKAQEAIQIEDLQATNAWFVEGLASYMEASPVGGISEEWLSTVQQAQQEKQLLPLEFLTVFRIASFRGMTQQAQYYAYSQSWALCHFLMHRYPEAFFAYLDRMAQEPSEWGEDFEWLLQAIGKDVRPLEQEFLAHLNELPREEPSWLRYMDIVFDLREELLHLMHRF